MAEDDQIIISLCEPDDMLLCDEFSSFDDLDFKLREYSRIHGFSVRIRNTEYSKRKKVKWRKYMCSYASTHSFISATEQNLVVDLTAEESLVEAQVVEPPAKEFKKPIAPRLRSTGCEWSCICSIDTNGKIYVKRLDPLSSHTGHKCHSVEEASVIWQHRLIPDSYGQLINNAYSSGATPSQIRDMIRHESHASFSVRDIDNYIQKNVRGKHCEDSCRAVQNILRRNKNGYIQLDTDADGNILRLCWSNEDQISKYRAFNDVVVIDTTYCTNIYGMKLMLAVVYDNHGVSYIVYQSLISDETHESWCWCIRHLLSAMKKKPGVIFSDEAKSIASAIRQELGDAGVPHILCLWHLLKNLKIKLKGDDEYHNGINSFLQAAHSSTQHEYNEAMEELSNALSTTEKHLKKKDSDYFNGTNKLESIKSQWAGYLIKQYFLGSTVSTQRVEAANSAIKRRVRRQLNLLQLSRVMHDTVKKQTEETLSRRVHSIQRSNSCKAVLQAMDSAGTISLRTSDCHSILFKLLRASPITDYALTKAQNNLTQSMDVAIKSQTTDGVDVVYKLEDEQNPNSREVIFYKGDVIGCKCSCLANVATGIPCKHVLLCWYDKFVNAGSDVDTLLSSMSQLFHKRWTIYLISCNSTIDEVLTIKTNELFANVMTYGKYQISNMDNDKSPDYSMQMTDDSMIDDSICIVDSNSDGNDDSESDSSDSSDEDFDADLMKTCLSRITKMVKDNHQLLSQVVNFTNRLDQQVESDTCEPFVISGAMGMHVKNPLIARRKGRPKTNENEIPCRNLRKNKRKRKKKDE